MKNIINRNNRIVAEDLTSLKRSIFIVYLLETDEFESYIYQNDIQ